MSSVEMPNRATFSAAAVRAIQIWRAADGLDELVGSVGLRLNELAAVADSVVADIGDVSDEDTKSVAFARVLLFGMLIGRELPR